MMTLFEDTELFMSGNRGTKTFDLPDADVMLIDTFFTKEESDYYYTTLLEQTRWHTYEMPMYEKVVAAPRMVSWFEDSVQKKDKAPTISLTPDLCAIRQRVETETQIKFNAVLLNLYRDGNDGVSWHSDKTATVNKNMIIASVTFGETRMFRLRHKFRKELQQVEIPLYHGSFLLMAGTTNSFWEHQVPKTARKVLPRINLTFRQVHREE
ncbi:alkylated DNA repair dioxygenase AlkB [Flavobacterium endophyticum]|uniref:Alkylated DNA repair dioxygenase AlkB n=1 Tax=Flavobacterium endophyticum TaxID=1540163 RepID=A0A495MDW9_9FLAO|nr:alpha-ketoglutarate-dependent dioxygenase AlkB [Flavobacterium endophyticum]RKS23272.1 alkylated DNA repair dioxygenase AlkB [Flavobacterium endophyticum]